MQLNSALVWTDSRFSFEREELKKKKSDFRELLVATEPNFDFQPWASNFYSAEQWSQEGNCWVSYSPHNDKLAEKIQNYLDKLDELQQREPIIAIKIAAILITISSHSFNISKQAKERLLTWLQDSNTPLAVKIDLGILISKNWPDQFLSSYSFTEVNSVIFDLMVELAKKEPNSAIQRIHEITDADDNHIFWIFNGSIDKKVTLGRYLKAVDPFFKRN